MIGIHNKNLLITIKVSNKTDPRIIFSFYCVILHVFLQDIKATLIVFSSSAWVQDWWDRLLEKDPFTERPVVAQLRECGRFSLTFALLVGYEHPWKLMRAFDFHKTQCSAVEKKGWQEGIHSRTQACASEPEAPEGKGPHVTSCNRDSEPFSLLQVLTSLSYTSGNYSPGELSNKIMLTIANCCETEMFLN